MTWFRRPVPRPDASLRLVCFPHAGGGATFYRWLADLAPDVEVLLVQYPGRENRITETMPPTMESLVASIVDALPPGPLALFGHSMGAAVAYEVARRVPVRALVVSGRAPGAPGGALHLAGDDDILAMVRHLGGTVPELLEHPEFREIIVDVMRGDLRILETHSWPRGPLLDVPIRALAGEEDPAAPPERVALWAAETTEKFALATFPGGHFYLVDHADAVRAEILDAIS